MAKIGLAKVGHYRTASALNRIINNSPFKRRISLEERKAQKNNCFFRGRQIAYLIYECFRVTGANDSVENYADLFTLVLQNDDIQEFDSKCDGILLSMTKIPPDDILESLYKLRIREIEKVKTVLELYDLETHQLTAMVKRSIEQEIRNKNFGARSGNFEKNAVVKNQGDKTVWTKNSRRLLALGVKRSELKQGPVGSRSSNARQLGCVEVILLRKSGFFQTQAVLFRNMRSWTVGGHTSPASVHVVPRLMMRSSSPSRSGLMRVVSSPTSPGLFDASFSSSELRHALTQCVDSAVGLDGLPYSLFKANFPWWQEAILSFLNLTCLGCCSFSLDAQYRRACVQAWGPL